MLNNKINFIPRFISKELKSTTLLSTDPQKECILCGSKNLDFYAAGYDYELNTCSNKWIFFKCIKCNHIQLNPIPSKSNLNKIYPSSYYSYSMSEKINPIVLLGKDILDKMKIKGIIKLIPKKINNYLDVGCGDGRYLRAVENICQLNRENIYGLELNKKTCLNLLNSGFKVFDCTIEDLKEIKPGSISMITMFHVIEHTKDPLKVITKLKELLTPGGYLIIETPNIKSIDANIFKNSFWGGYHFPRHWHLFTPSTLLKLIRSVDLIPIRISYKTGHSFWLYSFHHLLKYQYGLRNLAKLFDPLRSVFLLVLVTIFDIARSKLGFKTSAMMIITQKPK